MPAVTSLSASVGPLVGRRREVTEVQELLEEARLVTVTGAGGSGKTRVALEVVARHEEAVFVQLAAVRDPELVAAAIAQELDLRGTVAEEALVEALEGRRLLVCLDNFEHVVDAAPLIPRLLAAAPELRILVTSRTALRLSGEQEFPLAPFDQREAVEFFTVRARRFRPTFEPDAAVAEICRRLDGLPLALELAAARVKLLSPAQILDRLERRLPLLGDGQRDVPERHRTLRAAIDWSYQLLTPEERLLFARLSVFPGGCTLDGAEAVGDEGADTFEQLASLLDKSLLRRADGEDEPWFRMLETLREYAAERLEEEGAGDEVRRRRAAYYERLARTPEQELLGDRYAYWLRVLRVELDNLDAVLAWGFEHDPQPALRIVAAWGSRLFTLAPARVAVWLERALAATSDPPPAVLRTAGYARLVVRDLPRAEELLSAAVAGHERAGQLGETGRARALLATTLAHLRRGDEARAAAAQALVEARAAPEELYLLMALPNVGSAMSVLGDTARARAALEEAIAVAGRVGAGAALFVAQVNLGTVLLREDPARADPVFRAALELARDSGDTQVVQALEGIAMAALLTGDVRGAARRFVEYATTARQVGRPAQVQSALAGSMAVALADGDAARAARLAGAARAVNPRLPLPVYLGRFEEEGRAALGAEAWERLGAEGAALPLDEALALAAGGEPQAGAGESVRRAFVFTDIVSSTQLLELIGDAAWGSLVDWHDRTLRALFAEHGGEEVDHAGDGFFVVFPAAREAVACAVAIQRTLDEHRRTQGFAPLVRVGVHETRAERAGGGYRGLGVHTAARIGAAAGAGEIVASVETAAAAGVDAEGDRRDVVLKGLAGPVPVVSLAWREA